MKWTRTAGLLILAAAAFACRPAAAGFDLDAVINRAETLAADKQYDRALDALLMAGLDVSRRDRPRLHLARGAIYSLKEDFYHAINEYGAAVRISGNDPCVRAERALFFDTIGEPGAALADTELALRGGCDIPELTALRGKLYFWNSDYPNAIDTLSEVLQHESLRPEAMSVIGIAYLILGYPDTAAAYLKETARLRPDNANALSELADALSMTGRLGDALALYRRSLELNPDHDIAANNYGYTLYVIGRTDEAFELFDRLNQTRPNSYSICNAMEIHMHREENEKAYAMGLLCIASLNTDPHMAHYERYYFRAALAAVDTLRRDPMALHPLTQLDFARRHEENGETADALAAALIAIMLEPANTHALFEAGRLYSLLGETGKAGSFLKLALALAGPGADFAPEARHIISHQALSIIVSAAPEF